MYNDHLSSEEAQERIQQRVREVESYNSYKQNGYDGYRTARWLIAFMILLIAVALWLLF